MRLYWVFSAPAAQLFASDPLIDTIKKEPQPTRVMAVPLAESDGRDPFLAGDALMANGVRAVLGYHGNQIARYDKLLGADQGYSQWLNPNVWRLLNVEYLLTDAPDVGFIANVTRVGGPVRNAAGDVTYLFRLPGQSPYSWVAPVIVKAPDDQVLATVLNPRFDVSRAALFDTSARVTGVEGLTSLPEALPLTTTVTHYEAGAIDIELSAPAPAGSALIASENYYPGWIAFPDDGRLAAVGRADFTLLGVELPAGTRRVSLRFYSEEDRAGTFITLTAIAAALLILAAGTVAERRKVA
jgi:hypothetical protein